MTKADNLKQRIINLIAQQGPISVAEYMNLCLSDPQSGYYMTREPFGKSGDFITAPEISQLFGEMIGIWCFTQWKSQEKSLGKSVPCTLCEIGPGRGTLMKDILRVMRQLAPDAIQALNVVMIETSPRLQEIQKQTLSDAGFTVEWQNTLTGLKDQPLILVANELFDALPIRQFVKTKGHYRERMIGISELQELIFVSGSAGIDETLLPSGHLTEPEGSIFEISPARSALMQQITEMLLKNTGAALLIDYGFTTAGFADTLQALKEHKFDDVFAHPGRADITSHVDFSALQGIAKGLGCLTEMTTQGELLLSLGIIHRAGQLGHGKHETIQEKIRSDLERLASPDQMGNLFKVLAVSSSNLNPLTAL